MRLPTAAATFAVGLIVSIALAACGGGGGNDNSIPPVGSTVGVTTPTTAPTAAPSGSPTTAPSGSPTTAPTHAPTIAPTVAPTVAPTTAPTVAPTATPTTVGNATTAQVGLNDNPPVVLGDASYIRVAGATTSVPIDGITCVGAFATTAQHFHSHLSLFVNGKQYAIPVAMGIYHPVNLVSGNKPNPIIGFYNIPAASVDPTACHYDIHVHAFDGVIHVETLNPTQVFTLKQFLDIWGVTMNTTGFWLFNGPTRWFETDESTGPPGSYHPKEITGVDPATIPLARHMEYTVEVGAPYVPIPNYYFAENAL